MKYLDEPLVAPGQCGKCGSAQRDFYIDTELSFDFFGAFYFCNICAAELAGLAGFATPAQVSDLQEKIAELETDKFSLQRQVDGLEKVVEGFTLVNSGSNVISDAGSSFVVSDPVVVEQSQSGESDVAEGEVGTSESVHDEGMAEFSDDAVPTSGEPFKLNI